MKRDMCRTERSPGLLLPDVFAALQAQRFAGSGGKHDAEPIEGPHCQPVSAAPIFRLRFGEVLVHCSRYFSALGD